LWSHSITAAVLFDAIRIGLLSCANSVPPRVMPAKKIATTVKNIPPSWDGFCLALASRDRAAQRRNFGWTAAPKFPISGFSRLSIQLDKCAATALLQKVREFLSLRKIKQSAKVSFRRVS